MFTDSHCHLASTKFSLEEQTEVLERAQCAGIHRIVTLATNLDDLELNLNLAKTHPNVHACLGIHPCDVTETPDNYMEKLKPLAEQPECVAIGETGLDYFHPAPAGWDNARYHSRQRAFLRQHFELAKELNKNIVIHTRDKDGCASLQDSLEIYSEYSDSVTAVYHCFLGPMTNASKIFELGGVISFTGITTFKNAKDCLSAAINSPKGKFMLETDSPYLAPVPHRGQRNEPSYTEYIAAHIAAARNETAQELAQHTEQTVERFFKL